MDNTQTFLLLGSIVLLALLVLNVNSTILSASDKSTQAQAITTATSVAQQMVDLISSKSFDQATVNSVVTDINNFTPYVSFGSEAGETPATYNDVDDYQNYNTTISTPRLGNVSVLVKVNYVNPNSPNTPVFNNTRMKRVEVKATSIYLPDTLRLYYYSSY